MRGSSTRNAQFRDSSSYWKWTGIRPRTLIKAMLQQPLQLIEGQPEVLRDHTQVTLAEVATVVEGIDRSPARADPEGDVRTLLPHLHESLLQRPPDLTTLRHDDSLP